MAEQLAATPGAAARAQAAGSGQDHLAPLVAALRPGSAVALAVVRRATEELVTHGRTEPAAGERVTPDTAFEVGSVSKTFTALLLAERVARGELAYDLPIDALLAPLARPTLLRGDPITLLHLATHTSGLPRLPPGLLRLSLGRFTSPYQDFTEARLLRALAGTWVRSRPGSRVHYSNYGVGLLGRLVSETGGSATGLPGVGAAGANAPGTDHAPWEVGTRYADLLAERVLRPLGMTWTGCEPDLVAPAVGHWHGRPLAPWRIPALPGAGAVRSTARDLARYLRAHLAAATGSSGLADRQPLGLPLARALREAQRPLLVRPGSANHDELCLVWNLRRVGGRELLFHTGGTRGFTPFVGFCPSTGTGFAALANSGPRLNGRFPQAAYDQLKAL